MNISGNEITLLLFFIGKDQKVIKIYVSDLSDFGTLYMAETSAKIKVN